MRMCERADPKRGNVNCQSEEKSAKQSMWLRFFSTKGSMPKGLGCLGLRVFFRKDNCKLLTSDSTMNLQAPSGSQREPPNLQGS